MQAKYGVRVYLEPGEAWALNAGYLVTTVLDTLQQRGHQPCHPGYLRRLPHPGCYRDALPPAPAGRRRARAKRRTPSGGGPCLLAGMSWGLQLRRPSCPGDKAHLRRYGHLHHLQEQPPAAHLAAGRRRQCRELVHFGYQDFKMRLGAQGNKKRLSRPAGSDKRFFHERGR